MRAFSIGVLLVGVVVLGLPPAGRAEHKPLFDGKTLAGWEGETEKTWRVEDGAIVGGSLEPVVPRNEFLCTTKSYGDYTEKDDKIDRTGIIGLQIHGGAKAKVYYKDIAIEELTAKSEK